MANRDNTCLKSFPKLPVWIIEYVWAHKIMDLQKVVDPSEWPDVNSQPPGVEDSWRLRVSSAQVYSIVKNRDVVRFEKVIDFLETTYRLLPTLVSPIKHMKIVFGLKTMVVMWMLRERRGMIDTVFKINQFFPRKLPHYEDQCNERELFLMRKNNADFKDLAQGLAVDKTKRDDYIKNRMESEYGERYAQKVEDRLLLYLHELDDASPADTYVDKILKKKSPVTEEEKLLLDIIKCDSTTIAKTLRKLLHCDVTSCRPDSSEHEGDNSPRTPVEFQSEFEAGQKMPGSGPHSSENDDRSDVRRHRGNRETSPETSMECATSSPRFCSKHQRWVRSFLQECFDESSEEPPPQTNVSSSPLLFLSSSSSTPSSQDLTPSDLVPRPPSQTNVQPQIPEQAKRSPKSPPQPSPRKTLLPNLLSPVVRLTDVASDRSFPVFNRPQASSGQLIKSRNKRGDSTSCPQVLTSSNSSTSTSEPGTPSSVFISNPQKSISEDDPPCSSTSSSNSSNQEASTSCPQVPTSPRCLTSKSKERDASTVSHDGSTSSRHQQSCSRLSRKCKGSVDTSGQTQSLDRFGGNSSNSSTSTSVFISNTQQPISEDDPPCSITSSSNSSNQEASTSCPQVLTSPRCLTSKDKDSTVDLVESGASTGSPDRSTSSRHRRSCSRLSRKYKGSVDTSGQTQRLDRFSGNISKSSTSNPQKSISEDDPPCSSTSNSNSSNQEASTSCPQVPTSPRCLTSKSKERDAPTVSDGSASSESKGSVSTSGPSQSLDRFSRNDSKVSTSTSTFSSTVSVFNAPSDESSRKPSLQNSAKGHLSRSSIPAPASASVSTQTCRPLKAEVRLSLSSQSMLLQSTLLQPCVGLARLSTDDCHRLTGGRSAAGRSDEDDPDSSFDPNALYSSHSSSGDDSFDRDPDYKPSRKKKRLLLDYETYENV